MKGVDSVRLEAGGAPAVKLSKSESAALNVDEYAPQITDAKLRTGFPKRGGQSLSFWLQQVRCDSLLSHRTTPGLPKEVDTVVIGSGITGTIVTKSHLETWPDREIVVLEAREFCSGATGRNAGHCKPDAWRGFGKYSTVFGAEQALKIIKNEGDTWRALVKYVREDNVDCDLWVGETLDVPMTEGVADVAKGVWKGFVEAGGNPSDVKVVDDPNEAAKISRLSGAQAVYAWPASTLQPWKLTAHIMRKNISLGANLQTHTLATNISPHSTQPGKWVIHTDRGDIVCKTVVHATNAYSAALEPKFKGLITPTPHMCNKAIPPSPYTAKGTLQNSYGVLFPSGALISINSRCTTDGTILFGGSNSGQRELDEWVEAHPERCIDDSFSGVESVRTCVKDFVDKEFSGWKDAVQGPGEGFEYSWSGIVGRSKDGVPWVGQVPGKKGQWVCVGHHGHGMARIFTAAPGLVKLMNGASWAETGLPEVYQLTESRLQKLKENNNAPKVAKL